MTSRSGARMFKAMEYLWERLISFCIRQITFISFRETFSCSNFWSSVMASLSYFRLLARNRQEVVVWYNWNFTTIFSCGGKKSVVIFVEECASLRNFLINLFCLFLSCCRFVIRFRFFVSGLFLLFFHLFTVPFILRGNGIVVI